MGLGWAIADILHTIIDIYSLIIIIWIILSWLIAFKIVNQYQPFVFKTNQVLSRLIEPVLRPIRRIMPDLGGIDLSPILLFLALKLTDNLIRVYIG